MSKLYNKYLLLKENNKESKLYLFRAGIFNIFIDDDAKIASEILNLKITKLNDSVIKCGFPETASKKYLDLLNENKIRYEIIDEALNTVSSTTEYINSIKAKTIIEKIKSVDINSISPLQAYELLHNLKIALQDTGGIVKNKQ